MKTIPGGIAQSYIGKHNATMHEMLCIHEDLQSHFEYSGGRASLVFPVVAIKPSSLKDSLSVARELNGMSLPLERCSISASLEFSEERAVRSLVTEGEGSCTPRPLLQFQKKR